MEGDPLEIRRDQVAETTDGQLRTLQRKKEENTFAA